MKANGVAAGTWLGLHPGTLQQMTRNQIIQANRRWISRARSALNVAVPTQQRAHDVGIGIPSDGIVGCAAIRRAVVHWPGRDDKARDKERVQRKSLRPMVEQGVGSLR